MRRKASSIRSTSSVSPTPSIDSGSAEAGRLRSTFSMSSISRSSGAKRRRSRINATASATTRPAKTAIATVVISIARVARFRLYGCQDHHRVGCLGIGAGTYGRNGDPS